jgi:hypothetical protein
MDKEVIHLPGSATAMPPKKKSALRKLIKLEDLTICERFAVIDIANELEVTPEHFLRVYSGRSRAFWVMLATTVRSGPTLNSIDFVYDEPEG